LTALNARIDSEINGQRFGNPTLSAYLLPGRHSVFDPGLYIYMAVEGITYCIIAETVPDLVCGRRSSEAESGRSQKFSTIGACSAHFKAASTFVFVSTRSKAA
jgi:hypothetical protein